MKGSRLHLDLFKTYRDLVESKSFLRTATLHSLSQSAVSQQLAFLERHFGKKLVDRGGKRFLLTEDGKTFLEGCGNILEAYESIVSKLRNARKEIQGTVRVETVYSIGFYNLAPYVRAFMRCCPRVNIHIEYNRSDWIYQNVLRGECDMGIVAYPWSHPRIRIVDFHKERLVLVCPAQHPFAKRSRVRLKELDGENFIAFDQTVPTGQVISRMLRQQRIHVNILHQFDNVETIKRSIEVGMGISILPDKTIPSQIRDKTLVGVAIAGKPIYRPTGIILDRQRSLSRATLAFLRWLSDASRRASKHCLCN